MAAEKHGKDIGKKAGYDIAAILQEMRQQYWQGLEEQEEQAPVATGDYLVFSLGGQSFAIATPVAREVLRPPRLVPVPRVGEPVLGIINLRGQVVAVTDLCPLLGLKRRARVEEGRLIIVEAAGLTTALAVEAVDGIQQYPVDAIEPLSQGPGAVTRDLALGQIARAEDLLILLDMERILAGKGLIVDHKKV